MIGVNQKMFVDEALDLTFIYAAKHCDKDEMKIVVNEMMSIAERTEYTEKVFSDKHTYIETQNLLSKLNEKESIRKSKGVYYTPCDVVHFIVANSIKAAFGKIGTENIGMEDLSEIPYKSFATKKTVFDPTCGSGEYLLVALENKFDLLSKNCKKVPLKLIHETVSTIYGNDINKESIIIAKLRLLLCVLKRFGVEAVKGISNVINRNFYSYDYVMKKPGEERYDIIVGNPPYVEDFKSGLNLEKKYGNIYANVLINASRQLNTNGSMGFIVPLSYISTPRMSDLRDELLDTVSEQFIMSYADRPDCLFDSVHQKLCILIGKQKNGDRKIYTGNYQYWYKEERARLFRGTQVVRNRFYSESCIPKLGTDIDVSIYRKITDNERMQSVYDVSRNGDESVYLNRREAFWMKAYREKVDDPEYKVFSFYSKEAADYCYCLINSSLFWWYWIGTSDCWHVSKELNGFKAPFTGEYKKATKLADNLRKKLEETKVYVGTKQTDYEYKHRECIKEIRAIDTYINDIFGLTKEESMYIKEFAFRYRTSGGAQ